MYLAVTSRHGFPCYVIRESYRFENHYRSRDLLSLGADPARYIVYPGGNSFYIDERVGDRLTAAGAPPTEVDLEKMFWPFLKPRIQRALECFRARELQSRSNRKGAAVEMGRHRYHIFDRRRLHFLKFGQMNPRRLDGLPNGLLRTLYHKSRDEIEQSLMEMERVLRAAELKVYTFVIFDLQQFFSEQFARQNPEFLEQADVDARFLEEICRLNVDEDFWSGLDCTTHLHPYLQRYLFMHFDQDYPSRSFADEFVRQFIDNHRRHQRLQRESTLSLDEAGAAFGLPLDELKKLNRSELARLFRRKAQRLHPDKGGDHLAFVRLTEAYHRLLSSRR